MPLTLEELKDRLKKQDEVSLLEVLDISSEEIVERFIDLIEDRFEKLEEELQDEDQEL